MVTGVVNELFLLLVDPHRWTIVDFRGRKMICFPGNNNLLTRNDCYLDIVNMIRLTIEDDFRKLLDSKADPASGLFKLATYQEDGLQNFLGAGSNFSNYHHPNALRESLTAYDQLVCLASGFSTVIIKTRNDHIVCMPGGIRKYACILGCFLLSEKSKLMRSNGYLGSDSANWFYTAYEGGKDDFRPVVCGGGQLDKTFVNRRIEDLNARS